MIRTTIILFLACLLCSCALKVAPSGGPPDTVPAGVESITPPSGTRNLNNPHFTVEYDDYVDRGIRNDITVIPKIRLGSSYSGDAVSIWFEETPEPNTTYSITIGTNWKDLRGNQAPSATTIVFSTGPDLDSGTISGTIENIKFPNVVLLAYPQADTLTSAFNPTSTIAPYQLPVGTKGTFTLGGLRDGVYRLIALSDANNNQLPDSDEAYGVASTDVTVVKGASADVNIVLEKDSLKTDSIVPKNKAKTDTSVTDTTNKRSERLVYPGSILGIFSASDGAGKTYVARFIGQTGIVTATVPVVAGAPWKIDTIPPGTYTIDVFEDEDGNGKYSHGSLHPFRFSERRHVTSTTVVVRERWTTEDVVIAIQTKSE